MNVQTKRWARPLALFIALTMIMMYSFGGVAFASINDVRVHYSGDSDTGYLVVTTVIGGADTYTAVVGPKQGSHYDGGYEPELPLEKGDSLNDGNVVTTVSTTIGGVYTTFGIDHSSAVGQKSANIFVGEAIEEREYDLSVSKSVDYANVEVGDTVVFTITVTNTGNVNAENVVLNDVWPEGLTITGISAEAGTSFDGLTWNIGDLAFGESVELQLTALATSVGTATNVASIVIDDDNDENNSDDATVTVSEEGTLPTYDLKVEKEVDNNNVTIGSIVSFTITAQNLGNTTITGVQLTDTWPSGLTGAAVVTHEGISFIGNVWNVGSLAPQEVKTLELTAIAEGEGLQTNTVTGTLQEDDLDDTNNSDSVDVTVFDPTQPPEPVEDLAITKTVNQASVTVGTGVTFTITVTNIGDTTMGAIEVKDTWPSGLTQGTATPAEGTTFDAVNNNWEVGTLGPDESRTLTIAAGTPTAGTYTNNVEIFQNVEGASPLEDDNNTNNTAAAIVTVTNPGTTGGGGGGGGTTTTITDPEPPTTDIPETETPTVEAPEATLEDEPIPLADVPQTGNNANIWLLLALMMGSGAGIVLLGRRKETVEK